ncbi:hypothetical protein F6P84_04065 [Streptococcus suis]|nr:hypothetical protein SSUST3_1927 [Streptococcus suis ST3]AER18259.1 hypothetical protein SSUD9_2101 [Streptococcus suis D9]ALA29702.1 membrane protein [Streptococcus suis]AML45692.1 hypothetical protein APQ97_00940 [Streptococcus suis]ASW52725.1 hypothetical protein A7J09_11775 [Streptococcus suis]
MKTRDITEDRVDRYQYEGQSIVSSTSGIGLFLLEVVTLGGG